MKVIYIWGTGRLVGKVVGRWIKEENVTGYIDNNPLISVYRGKKVYRPDELKTMEYDAIIVINLFSDTIMVQAKKIGLNINKFIFLYKNCYLKDLNEDYVFVDEILGKEYSEIVKKRYHVVRGIEAYGDMCFQNTRFEGLTYMDTDYVRIKSFELVVKEIRKKKIAGAVAEAGVFRGEFAQYINYAFPDRKCYLFDTFEGFEDNEANKEVLEGNITDTFVEAYSNTSVQIVKSRMTFFHQIDIRQGLFPKTTEGINEFFAFVSLDMDLENSILDGLRYFYPRMSSGGYIFVHDYNSSLRGVEKAVDRYEGEIDDNLKKMPLCDANGTLVIIK